ncbi:MAG: hypothetical protein JWQ35_906 [Bacteriovoracaceae bacterium]|nr:hypothetical protein [Bacteriovoracaceae bacterium]
MNPQEAEARYQLTLLNYPNTGTLAEICRLIYQTEDKNLIASLSTLPYIVGRRFSHPETEHLHSEFKRLKVGHRFQCDKPGITAPSYDPNHFVAERKEESKKVVEINKFKKKAPVAKFSRKWILGLIIISLLGAIFYFISKNKIKTLEHSESPSQTYEAKIETVDHDVEFRIADDLLWKKAKDNILLQTKDSVRTFQDSRAYLKYREGSLVTVHPNTFLIIGKETAPNRKVLKLEDGILQARMKPSDQAQHLSIETSSGILEMESPKGTELKEMKIETSMNKGTLTVSVTEGQATLTPKAKDSPVIKLDRLQQITATEKNVSAPVPFIPKINLFAPVMNEAIVIDPQKSSAIRFKWEALGDNANYELSLSIDPEMKEVLIKQTSSVPQLEFSYLDLGILYWQVSATLDGVKYKSPIWRLYVQKSQ